MPLQTNIANGASTNNVNHGAMSGVDWAKFTVGGWWTPTTVTLATRGMCSKGVSAGARLSIRQDSALLGQVGVVWVRATTSTVYRSTAGYVTANRPMCLFITGDQAASPVIHIYIGYLESPLAEVTYATTTDGSGAFTSIAAQPFRMNSTEVPDVSFSGMCHHAWVFENRILAMTEMTQLGESYQAGRGMKPSLMCRYGANGTGKVLDESGNNYHGTITGAYPTNAVLPRVSRRRAA